MGVRGGDRGSLPGRKHHPAAGFLSVRGGTPYPRLRATAQGPGPPLLFLRIHLGGLVMRLRFAAIWAVNRRRVVGDSAVSRLERRRPRAPGARPKLLTRGGVRSESEERRG